MTDPILQNLSHAAAHQGEDQGAVIHLAADGLIWQGRLVSPAVWAAAQADTPSQDDNLRDTAADASDYLHFTTASCYTGGRWLRMHNVRIATAAVSAWWLNHSDD